MSGRPLLLATLPVLTVLAICLYLRRRGRSDSDPPESPPPDQPAAEPTAQQTAEPAAEAATEPTVAPAVGKTAGGDLGQVTAWVRDNIETRSGPEPAAVRGEPEGALEEKVLKQKTPEPAAVGAGGDALRELEAAIKPAQTDEQDRALEKEARAAKAEATVAAEEAQKVSEVVEVAEETPVSKEEAPVASAEAPITSAEAPITSAEAPITSVEAPVPSAEAPAAKKEAPVAETQSAKSAQELPAASEEAAVAAAAPAEAVSSTPAPASGAEASESAVNGTAETGADTASENSSDSGKGGSSASLEQTSQSNSPDSAPLQTTVYDFLIPQKLCGRLIGKNGTFVNMLKSRTGAHVIIRLHPVKSSVKICSVDGTQSEIDACLKMIREKFPVNKFPAMTLEQLNRPTEQSLAVPDSQQLHLSQGVTCDVLVSAVVSAGQLFLQQHTHPTFRGLERLTSLMAACYGDGGSTPELPRPVLASSICAAPVAGGWYRAQVVAFYPDSDELDVRFMDFGGYSRIPAAHARQIRTDFMSLPFQAEECYLANVMPLSEDGWSLEAGAVFESLITDRALEAMVVGYAEDGTPFVNLYSIQGTEYGNSAITLVNQRLVESGAARWVENQA